MNLQKQTKDVGFVEARKILSQEDFINVANAKETIMKNMNKTIKTICAYCEEAKQCVKWDKTDEMVCYDCRLDFLNEEFEEPREYKSDLFPELDNILKDFPSIRK